MLRLPMPLLLAGVGAALLCATVSGQQQSTDAAPPILRVGTFDSRAVAAAYVRSDIFKRRFESLMAEYKKAKAADDQKRVQELEAQGKAGQDLLHKQGFGTWPVDDILEHIQAEIPKIAEQAGVQVIVSKWHIVYQQPGTEFVDVTDLVVKPFNPDEKALKTIQELRKHKPVPLDEIEKHNH